MPLSPRKCSPAPGAIERSYDHRGIARHDTIKVAAQGLRPQPAGDIAKPLVKADHGQGALRFGLRQQLVAVGVPVGRASVQAASSERTIECVVGLRVGARRDSHAGRPATTGTVEDHMQGRQHVGSEKLQLKQPL